MVVNRLAESVKVWKLALGALACLLLGTAAGGYATWRHLRPPNQWKEVRDDFENPGDWLMPPGTALQDLFPDEGFREAILHPDSIRVHQIGGDEALLVGPEKWAFSSVGVEPGPERTERLLHALGSMTSYRTPSACIFNPGVLVRLEKAGKIYGLVFCFSCNDVRLFPGQGDLGMTAEGRKAFIWCFSDMLPGFAELQKLRDEYKVYVDGK
jgi:hypothetical protein